MGGFPSDGWQEYGSSSSRKLPASVVRTKKVIGFNKLCEVAESINSAGGTCRVDENTYAYGGVNILFELRFESGETWIARIRLETSKTPIEGIDFVLESEVATMRLLRAATRIRQVPDIYGHDSHFGNSVGMPYILMEAMSGVRLWGGGRKDFIPDEFKPKVYRQISEIMTELYHLEFDEIGMLFPDPQSPRGVKVGPIYDSSRRFDCYGPFTTSLDFYKTRAELLNEYRLRHFKNGISATTAHVIAPKDEPEAIQWLIDPSFNRGPFRLTHPDFQISNFLFDDTFNITGLVDWEGCQTVPFESFARHPDKIIPNANQFLDGWDLSDELRDQWAKRRKNFLDILRHCEQESGTTEAPIANMMLSPRSHFAMCLDMEGILGIPWSLPKEEFEVFVGSIRDKLHLSS